MFISSKSIVSNSEMIKNYKSCRAKAEGLGRVFVLKFNQPDAVLFSIREYEKIHESLQQVDHEKDLEIAHLTEELQKKSEH